MFIFAENFGLKIFNWNLIFLLDIYLKNSIIFSIIA